MKIIEILNKIANGEELPKKIKYDDKIYYMVGNNDYENYEYEEEPTLMYAIGNTHNVNEEVEVIEEDKKIEKIIPTSLKGIDNLDEKIEIAHIDTISAIDKINEIIDVINKGE